MLDYRQMVPQRKCFDFWPHQRVYGRVITAGWAGVGYSGGRKRRWANQLILELESRNMTGSPSTLVYLGQISWPNSDRKTFKLKVAWDHPIGNGIFALMRPSHCWHWFLVSHHSLAFYFHRGRTMLFVGLGFSCGLAVLTSFWTVIPLTLTMIRPTPSTVRWV